MAILLYSDLDAERFANPQVLHAPTADGRQLLVFSGVVLTNLRGQSAGWTRTTLTLFLSAGPVLPSGQGFRHDGAAASVSLGAVWDKGASINAGFAVDSTVVLPGTLFARWVGLRCAIGVSDSDAFLYRVTYNVTVTGAFTDFSAATQVPKRPTSQDIDAWERTHE